MAPKPPKIRPRPQRTAITNDVSRGPSAHPTAKQEAPKHVAHSAKAKDFDQLKDTMFYKPQASSAPIDSSAIVVRKRTDPEHSSHRHAPHQHGAARPHGHGDASRRTEKMYRMSSAIKRNPIADKKLYAQENSLKGHEQKDEHGTTGGLKRDTLYYVPLGGLEEVGRNSMFFEYNDEIVIVDMGIQFPVEETPGVDWIIPNVSYLEKKKQNIKALIITHAHYDHFGAVPYVLEKLGNPTIYGTGLIRAVLEKRLAEIPNAPKMKFHEIKNHDKVKLSENFTAEFFGVSHTVPDTTGVALHTPAGLMVHFADFRLDYDEEGTAENLQEFERLGKMNVHTLCIDSTNAWESGHSVSEKIVEANLEKMMLEAEGRIILSTFASMITRIAEIVKIAEKIGRKVMINGRSMKENLEIARSLGYVKFKPGSVVPIEDIAKYKDDKILILSTGAQGQENAGLMRIVNGEHRFVKVKVGDTVIFSSSVIPGNERGVQTLKDNFARQGATVITNNDLDIHSSGHAPGADLGLVAQLCKPKFVIPVHGHYFMRASNVLNMKRVGIPKERVILMDNGQIAEVTPDNVKVTDKTVDAFYVLVDGLGVGDVEAVVLRDRKLLSQEGMVVIISTVDRRTGRLMKNPDVISRGFIYLKDHTSLIDEIRTKIRNILTQTQHKKQSPESDYIKGLIRDQVGLFLYNKTMRRPMILPVIIEV